MTTDIVKVSVEVPRSQISTDEVRNLENELALLVENNDHVEIGKRVSVNIPISILTVVLAVISVLKKSSSRQDFRIKSSDDIDMEVGGAMKADWVIDRATPWPETNVSAMYAFCPEKLSPAQLQHIDRLFNESASFRKMIQGARRDREWLAPQYGL